MMRAVFALAMLAAGCGDGEKSAADGNAVRDVGTLVAVTVADSPPFSYRDPETGEITGLEIDIMREAASKLGRSLEVRVCPFDELIADVKNGTADMAASSFSITDARREVVDFSIPYDFGGGRFLYRAGEPEPSMILAERLRVATVESMTYDFYLCAHGIDPVRFRTYPETVEALKAGMVDAVMFDGSAVLRAAELSGGTLAASRLESRERLAIVVRKGMIELKTVLDEVIFERKNRK